MRLLDQGCTCENWIKYTRKSYQSHMNCNCWIAHISLGLHLLLHHYTNGVTI